MLSVFDVAAIKVKEANTETVVENFRNVVDAIIVDYGSEGVSESFCNCGSNALLHVLWEVLWMNVLRRSWAAWFGWHTSAICGAYLSNIDMEGGE